MALQRVDGLDEDARLPSLEYVYERLERTSNDAINASHRLDLHETECLARFRQLVRDISDVRFWLKLSTAALVVLFLSSFLHLDLVQIIKLFAPLAQTPL